MRIEFQKFNSEFGGIDVPRLEISIGIFHDIPDVGGETLERRRFASRFSRGEKVREALVQFDVQSLTEKQREVLDLLLDHKTSKEIAKFLGISPHTVDQRIQFAKRRLGASSRSDLARRYRELKPVYDRVTYDDSHMSSATNPVHQMHQDDRSPANYPLRFNLELERSVEGSNRIVPELFEGHKGKWFRLVAVLAIALLLLLLTLGGLITYSTLASVLSG